MSTNRNNAVLCLMLSLIGESKKNITKKATGTNRMPFALVIYANPMDTPDIKAIIILLLITIFSLGGISSLDKNNIDMRIKNIKVVSVQVYDPTWANAHKKTRAMVAAWAIVLPYRFLVR